MGIHELTSVGVYPVLNGYAHLDLDAVTGKGTTKYNPLYIAPGDALFLPCGSCTSTELECLFHAFWNPLSASSLFGCFGHD